jgi:rhodanese-related sulfurtransferase
MIAVHTVGEEDVEMAAALSQEQSMEQQALLDSRPHDEAQREHIVLNPEVAEHQPDSKEIQRDVHDCAVLQGLSNEAELALNEDFLDKEFVAQELYVDAQDLDKQGIAATLKLPLPPVVAPASMLTVPALAPEPSAPAPMAPIPASEPLPPASAHGPVPSAPAPIPPAPTWEPALPAPAPAPAPKCHRSAGTPLGTHANGQDSGLEESRPTICT